MFLRSLQWRLVSFFCLVTFCLIVPIGLFLNKQVEDSYYDKFIKGIENGFDNWKIKSGDKPSRTDLVNEMKASVHLFSANELYKSYTVAGKKGNIIATNDTLFRDNPGSGTNILLESDNFVQAMTGTGKNRQILEKYADREYFDYAGPIGEYIIYFKYYKEDWVRIIEKFNDILITGLLVAMAIAFFLGYLLSRTITAPLDRLMNKARSIAAGDFDQLLEVKSNDEISKLTETFNSMAISLKNTLTEISSEKNKMETIFNYMTDGIIAFNVNGEVIHTNPASKRMLGEEEITETFDYYVKRFGIDYSIKDVLYLNSNRSGEVTLKIEDRSVRVYTAVFTDENRKPGGIIAVLQDITEQERLENMRKEFVANVSHELRTPLTSIKSYAETLLDGALEDRESAERFLGVINSEADRMTRLVKDLLQLSRLDNQQLKWNMEEMSFVNLVKSVVERMEMEARNKKQMLECHVIGNVPGVVADYGRLEQVVLNLLSNAIKYTPEGGKISVFIGKTKNEVYMKVEDTGIGIPENDLPRIFERFYRVDKARSREMGGTGLGLSIAKEIVEAHSGAITITSKKDKGTEVFVRLPVDQTKQLGISE